MVVQHNLQAMNSNRMLGITQKTVAGSTEKLSSGYKINRAADDAAGLSISEKMRKQIRGLDQASANAEDGISSVQTAEGALQEVTDMLQRMNELAVQAANGTNSTTDRQYIQDEVDQLITEIDRVAETTKFNETYLLKGDEDAPTTTKYTFNYSVADTADANSNVQTTANPAKNVKVDYVGDANVYMVKKTDIDGAKASSPVTADVITKGDDFTKYLDNTSKVGANSSVTTAGFNKTDYVAFKNTTLDTATLQAQADGSLIDTAKQAFIFDTETNSVIHVAKGEDLSSYIEKDANGNYQMKDRYRNLNIANGATLTDTTTVNGAAVTALAKTDLKGNASMQKLYDADGKEVSGVALNKYFTENGDYKGGLYKDSQATSAINNNAATDANSIHNFVTKNTAQVAGDLSFSLHVGADSARTNKIETKIQSMSAAALGIDKLSSKAIGIVDESGDNATDAIDVIASALQQVSTQRSALGAVQNRLEHTIKNLDNVVENTQSAESAIRDTDMAEEMVKYSNANILSQAGQSMLAQANQSNQGVLSILG